MSKFYDVNKVIAGKTFSSLFPQDTYFNVNLEMLGATQGAMLVNSSVGESGGFATIGVEDDNKNLLTEYSMFTPDYISYLPASLDGDISSGADVSIDYDGTTVYGHYGFKQYNHNGITVDACIENLTLEQVDKLDILMSGLDMELAEPEYIYGFIELLQVIANSSSENIKLMLEDETAIYGDTNTVELFMHITGYENMNPLLFIDTEYKFVVNGNKTVIICLTSENSMNIYNPTVYSDKYYIGVSVETDVETGDTYIFVYDPEEYIYYYNMIPYTDYYFTMKNSSDEFYILGFTMGGEPTSDVANYVDAAKIYVGEVELEKAHWENNL